MSEKETTFEYPEKFVTEYGVELALPRPTAKIERQVYQNVGKILQDFPAARDLVNQFMGNKRAALDKEIDWAGNIVDIIQLALLKVPEPLSRIAQAILGLADIDAVEDSLTYADMVRLVVLFFRLQTSRFSGASVRLVEDFNLDQEPKLSQLAEQAVTDEAEV